MIATMGGRFGGYAMFLQKGKPVFVYNLLDSGAIPLGRRHRGKNRRGLVRRELKPGKHTLVFDFKYDGPGPGKGGTGVFTVDGKELAKKTIPHSIPMLMSIDESFDIGSDTRTGVDNSYELPFKFTGTIDKLTYKLGPSQMADADKKSAAEVLAKARD
jgi:arylsulfatase